LLLGGVIGLMSALCYLLLIRDEPIMIEMHHDALRPAT
jgi:hypothetical protein